MSDEQKRVNQHFSGIARNDGSEAPNTPFVDGSIENLLWVTEACEQAQLGADAQALRSVIRNMQDVVILVDKNYRLLEMSNVAAQHINANVDLSLKPDSNSAQGACSNSAVAALSRCMGGERIQNEMHEIETAAGIRQCIVNATPILNKHGEIEMALLVARDITEFHRMQVSTENMLAEIRRQQASLKYLIDNLPAGVILLDKDLKIISWSKSYRRYVDELVDSSQWRVGAHIRDALPLAEESGIAALLKQAYDLQSPTSAQCYRYDGMKSGPTYWNASIIPIRIQHDGSIIHGMALVIVDITKEVRAREQLAELAELAKRRAEEVEAEQSRLDTIIRSTPIPLVVCDSEGRFIASNSAALAIAEECELQVGKTITNIFDRIRMLDCEGNLLHLEDIPIYRSLRGQTCTGMIIRMPDQKKVFSINSAPLRDSARNVVGVVAALMDMTEQVKRNDTAREEYLREHAIAEKLQRCFLPDDLPPVDGFEIAQRYRPALNEALVGGDFYDIFPIDQHMTGIVMADVAGKGLKAAVYTAMTKYMLRAYALDDDTPENVLCRLNDALCVHTPSEVFVTLVYGIIDSRKRTFTYTNAGHEKPVIWKSEDGTAVELEVTGRALGLEQNADFSSHTVQMNVGDTLILYTDGITDAGSGANRFGQEGLLHIIRSAGELSVRELANAIVNSSTEFANDNLGDDTALLVIRAKLAEHSD